MTEAPIHTPETEHSTRFGWMFDIDGVITNPDTAKRERPEITDFIADRLKKGEPVALVTGRALKFVRDEVLPYIEGSIENPDALKNLFVSAEFGGSNIVWKDGKQHHFVDPNIAVPFEMAKEVKDKTGDYSSTHFIDPDKETMVSLEKLRGMPVSEFKPAQLSLAEELEKIVTNHDPEGKFEVHVDRIATNVRQKNANKEHATEQVLDQFKGMGKDPEMIYVFGDSKSYLEMPKKLHALGRPFQFVFVGEPEMLEHEQLDFPYLNPGHCDDGVVNFINDFNTSR